MSGFLGRAKERPVDGCRVDCFALDGVAQNIGGLPVEEQDFLMQAHVGVLCILYVYSVCI